MLVGEGAESDKVNEWYEKKSQPAHESVELMPGPDELLGTVGRRHDAPAAAAAGLVNEQNTVDLEQEKQSHCVDNNVEYAARFDDEDPGG